ncbi:hypothetical protein ASE93_16765 [Serratia sp. Leaf50]|nr:hypothetical protein ASE93_16765 [Serratia sp. Leaf50]
MILISVNLMSLRSLKQIFFPESQCLKIIEAMVALFLLKQIIEKGDWQPGWLCVNHWGSGDPIRGE